MSTYLTTLGSAAPTLSGLGAVELSPMQRLILCIGQSFAETAYQENTANNSDAWITDLWACYHPYANYGAYCMVGASTIINAAARLAKEAGAPCADKLVPSAPLAGSQNRENTLYGNVYDTLNELRLSGAQLSGNPSVGDLFMRPSDNGRTNHAGIVVEAPLTADRYLVTIEANVSTSGNGATTKGFQKLVYTKAQYDAFQLRTWVQSARAAAYGNFIPQGWIFASLWQNCQGAPEKRYQAALCLNVNIDCDLTPQAPPPAPPVAGTSPCDTSVKPPEKTGFTSWRKTADVIAEINEASRLAAKPGDAVGLISILPREGYYGSAGREASPDGCWVRWEKAKRTSPPPPPPPVNPCKSGFVTKSCCEGAATTLRFGSAGDLVTLADLDQNKGAREALLSSVINADEFKRRGYDQKMNKAVDYVPMLRLSSGVPVMVYVETSEQYAIASTLKLFGARPKFIKISRTLSGFTGGGYAERLAGVFTKDTWGRISQSPAPQDAIVDETGSRAEWTRTVNPSSGVIGASGFLEFNLWRLIESLEKRGNDLKARGESVVILFTGEPQSGLDVLASLAGTIGGALNYALPGVGTLFSSVITKARNAYVTGTLGMDDAFALIGDIGGALSNIASDNADGKILGVDGKFFADVSRYSSASGKVYQTLLQQGTVAQKAYTIANIIGKDVPELTDLARAEFADEEKWARNAFADINKVVGGAFNDVRAAVHNVADGAVTNILGNLSQLDSGIDSIFAGMLTDTSSLTKTAAKIPLIQDLLTTSADPSLINAKAGSADIFSRILNLTATYGNDVSDAAIHNAIAAVASGKRVVEGALDKLTYDSLLHKAEEFTRRGWKFDVPLTLGEEKRECIQKEIAVCLGTECCAPFVLQGSSCVPPGETDAVETPGDPAQPQDPTAPRPTLPSCIKPSPTGGFVYCMPPECQGAPTNTSSAPKGTEVSRISRTNDNGAPYDIIATRQEGTQEWQTFTVEAYTPQGNEWVKTGQEPKGDATGLITSDEFETLRSSSQAGITLVPAANSGAATTTLSPGGAGACLGVYPARLSADGSGRYVAEINGQWSLLSQCCPTAQAPAAQGETCCNEVRLVSKKVDQLVAEIARQTALWASQKTTTAPTTTSPAPDNFTYTSTRGGAFTVTPAENNNPIPGEATAIAPVLPCCDLQYVIALIEELPRVLQGVDTVTYTGGGAGTLVPTERTAAQTADLTELSQALVRIEQTLASIPPQSPCDNSQVLTALVRLEAMIQQKAVAYDDRVLQGKIDRLTEMVSRIPTSTAQGGGATTTTDNTATIERLVSEIQVMRQEYAAVTEKLTTLISRPPVVCDTESLRRDILIQTESIKELRTLVENGARIDTSAIERELVRQGELLRLIAERIDNRSVVMPATTTTDTGGGGSTSTATTTEKTFETIATCDDAWLRQAMAEMREMIRLLPDVRGELAIIRGAIDSTYKELRSQIDEALVILRELQARKAEVVTQTSTGGNGGAATTQTTTTQTTSADLTRIETMIAEQREYVKALVERGASCQAATCDVDDLRTMLRTIETTQTETKDVVAQILQKVSERQTTTTTSGGESATTVQPVLQCDTSLILDAVRQAIKESTLQPGTTTTAAYDDSNVMAKLERILQAIEAGGAAGVVREVVVDLSQVESKLDRVLDELRSRTGYDDAELREKIDRLYARPNYDDQALREKIDLVLDRVAKMDENVRLELSELRQRVEARSGAGAQQTQQSQQTQTQQSQQTQAPGERPSYRYNERGECLDCPAFVEEHRRVFYQYPTEGQIMAQSQAQQQQQQQQQQQMPLIIGGGCQGGC